MPESEQKRTVTLHSEGIQEILGAIPAWIVRWGMLMFLGIILLLFIAGYFFNYPHIVQGSVVLTSEFPPSQVVSRTNGRIVRLFVVDAQEVRKDQVLALIENTATFDDVLLLKKKLAGFSIDSVSFGIKDSADFPFILNLGTIQPFYSGFIKQLNDLHHFTMLNYHEKKIHSIEAEIDGYEKYIHTLIRQRDILFSELKLTHNQFRRDSLLFVQGVFPEADYDHSRSSFLNAERSWEEAGSSVLEAKISVTNLNQEVLDLRLNKNEQLKTLVLGLNESLENLLSAIKKWEQNYVLQTTVDGEVSFTRFWSRNQYVSEGDLVMTIIPANQGEIIGKLEMMPAGAGKVKPGMQVKIKLDNYPHIEYGMLSGSVKSVSMAASENAYTVIISLNKELITNYGILIPFHQDMQGRAEIITNKESLLSRIFNPVKSVLLKQKNLRE